MPEIESFLSLANSAGLLQRAIIIIFLHFFSFFSITALSRSRSLSLFFPFSPSCIVLLAYLYTTLGFDCTRGYIPICIFNVHRYSIPIRSRFLWAIIYNKLVWRILVDVLAVVTVAVTVAVWISHNTHAIFDTLVSQALNRTHSNLLFYKNREHLIAIAFLSGAAFDSFLGLEGLEDCSGFAI